MKENKFRGISQYTGEMVYGQLLRGENNFNIVTNFSRAIDIELVPIKKGTQGQFTGLIDKNGREIYEDDILRYLDSYDCSTESGYDFEEFLNIGEIVYNKEMARFDITNKSDIGYEDWIEIVSECEVIGNTHENPELLNVSYK